MDTAAVVMNFLLHPNVHVLFARVVRTEQTATILHRCVIVGICTNVCRVSLILMHTKWLQSGLASKVAAFQHNGQGLMSGKPNYFFVSLSLSLFATSGLLLCPMQVTVQVQSGYLLYGVK
jgi:ABC-type uncharacterized transport system permease subunit